MNADRAGCSRRGLLTAAAGGLAACGASPLLRGATHAAAMISACHDKPQRVTGIRSCVLLLMNGGASHIDLFDPKPALARFDGTPLPESARKDMPPGFISEDARLMASPFGFRRYGRSGMALSELLPRIGSCADDMFLLRSMRSAACNHFAASADLLEGLQPFAAESIPAPHAEGTAHPSLSKESRHVRAVYGLDRADAWATSVSTECLLARQRVERGDPFVAVQCGGWDHHQNLREELAHACAVVDQPVAALLKDLKSRGLLASTLVLLATEFGRAPMGESARASCKGRGRDHHPLAFSILVAGAGVPGGQIMGETDDLGWNVAGEPVPTTQLHHVMDCLRSRQSLDT